jgi:phytoene synthase
VESTPMTGLEDSYAHCRHIARTRAKNFYYSFLILPAAKRRAMCAVYAFMRECDDRSDEAGATLERIADWRAQLDATLESHMPDHPVWPAFGDTAQRFRIPPRYFHEMLDGVASDLTPRAIESFHDLNRYCYLVAGVVGLTIIHIFGFEDPNALVLAEHCGVAFQLTNILRDIGEDAARGRIYLPVDELRDFDVSPEQLRTAETTPEVRALLAFQAERAARYYEESRPLIQLVHHDSRRALWALSEVYRRTLARIVSQDYPVLERRVRLTTSEKLWLVARAAAGWC